MAARSLRLLDGRFFSCLQGGGIARNESRKLVYGGDAVAVLRSLLRAHTAPHELEELRLARLLLSVHLCGQTQLPAHLIVISGRGQRHEQRRAWGQPRGHEDGKAAEGRVHQDRLARPFGDTDAHPSQPRLVCPYIP